MYETCVRRHILTALGHRPLNTLRRTDIAAFVAGLTAKGLAPSTVESIYNLLAMILRNAVYDRLLPVSPCHRIKLPPRPPRRLMAFTPKEVRLLFEVVRPQHRAVLATTAGTGMRQGELLGLRVQHINFLRRQLSVEEQCLTPQRGQPYITTEPRRPCGAPSRPLARAARRHELAQRGHPPTAPLAPPRAAP